MPIRRQHRLALECALLALVAYLGAFGVSAVVRSRFDDLPAREPEDETAAPAATIEPLAAYAVIAERDVFNPTPDGAGPAATSRTPHRLEGIALHGREARAVLEDTITHRQELYRVGDTVGDARITAIDWDRVTLTRGGREEILELGTPGATADEPAADTGIAAPPPAVPVAADARIRRTGENAYLVDRRELAGATDNMSALLTQLRAVAEVRDGR